MITPRLSTVCVLAAMSIVIGPRTADAQVQVTSWTPMQEGPAITSIFGSAVTNNPSNKRGSFELATWIDTPVDRDHVVRLEAAKSAWHFSGYEYFQAPASGWSSNPGRGELATDRVSITRLTASVIRRNIVLEGDVPGSWTPFYAGGGIGAYYFQSHDRQPYARPWRFGIHGLAGLEFPLPNTRLAIVGEVQMHMPGVPAPSVARTDWFAMLSGSLGIKIRM